MSLRFGGPAGKGWSETLPQPAPDIREWKLSDSLVRREYGSRYVEVLHSTGRKIYTGEGGGYLELNGKGGAFISMNGDSLINHTRKSGAKTKLVTPQGKRRPPKAEPQARLMASIRSLVNYPANRTEQLDEDWQETWAPRDPESERARELMSVLRQEAYHLIRAIICGNSDELRLIAEWVDIDEKRRTGNIESPKNYDSLAEAIKTAALKCEGVPQRSEVEKEFRGSVSANRARKVDIRDDLARIGFGWLPAPSGKPSRGASTRKGGRKA